MIDIAGNKKSDERVSLRFEEDDFKNLEKIMKYDGTNRSDAIRKAVEVYSSIVNLLDKIDVNEVPQAIDQYVQMQDEIESGNAIVSLSPDYVELLKQRGIIVLKKISL